MATDRLTPSARAATRTTAAAARGRPRAAALVIAVSVAIALTAGARIAHAQVVAEQDSAFAAIGFASGTPGYVNAVASYYGRSVAVVASAGAWRRRQLGAQGALVWRALHHPDFTVGPALVVGTFDAVEDTAGGAGHEAHHRQTYAGPALDLYLSGFHLQTGLAIGSRPYPRNPQLVVQVGYLFRIR